MQKQYGYSRQLSLEEVENPDIAAYEALAVEMCLYNIDMSHQPRVVRYKVPKKLHVFTNPVRFCLLH